MSTVDESRVEELPEPPGARLHVGALRLVVCGSAGGGKSALVERLTGNCSTAFAGQHGALPSGTQKDEAYASGTEARDAGVPAGGAYSLFSRPAYRPFCTSRRSFLIADVPGRGHYAASVAAAASIADLVILVVDASQELLTQAQSPFYLRLLSIMGAQRVVLAVSKMDKAGYSEERFRQIEHVYRDLAQRLALRDAVCIPVSAADDANILRAGVDMPWFHGPTLADYLDTVPLDEAGARAIAFRMQVEQTLADRDGTRSVAGSVAGGEVRVGDRVRILPSGAESRVRCLVNNDTQLARAMEGQSLTLTLAEEIEVSPGDMLCAVDSPAQLADQFDATVVWSGNSPMLRGRTYLLAIGCMAVPATIAPLKYKINMQTLEHVAADKLELNEIGVCELELSRAIAFDPYSENRATGSFVLVDRVTSRSVGFGILNFALRRAHNVHRYALTVDKAARAALKSQKSCVLWLTGLSASGKSTIANLIDKKLHALGRHTYVLDGDNVRSGLNKDLGFTAEDRVENIRRIAEVAKLMVDAGLIVLAAFISPFRSERRMARDLLPAGEFIEIFVDTPLPLAERRDPKGLYKKARRGEIKNFTGLDSPYEQPEAAEIRIETANISPEEAADRVIAYLRDAGMLDKA